MHVPVSLWVSVNFFFFSFLDHMKGVQASNTFFNPPPYYAK